MARSSYDETRYGGRIKIGNFIANTNSMSVIHDNYGYPHTKTFIEVEIRGINDADMGLFDVEKYRTHQWVWYKTLGQGIKMGDVNIINWSLDTVDGFSMNLTIRFEVSYYEIRVL